MIRETLTYQVCQGDQIHTIYMILRSCMGASARVIRACRNEGDILLNGVHVRTVDRAAPGDVLTLVLPKTRPPAGLLPERVPLTVCYEDRDFLAVNKPAGMAVHPSKGHPYGTLLNAVAGYMERTNEWYEPHLINRLDRGTSGIVLIGKHAFVQEALAQMGHGRAEEGGVEKIYHAVTVGIPSPREGIIDRPIGQPDLQRLERAVLETGAPSQTVYRVVNTRTELLQTLKNQERQVQLADVECRLLTGRTHQIRVHLASIGCPIAGDLLYGTDLSFAYAKEKGLTHQTLVACELRFIHPITGELVEIRC